MSDSEGFLESLGRVIAAVVALVDSPVENQLWSLKFLIAIR